MKVLHWMYYIFFNICFDLGIFIFSYMIIFFWSVFLFYGVVISENGEIVYIWIDVMHMVSCFRLILSDVLH